MFKCFVSYLPDKEMTIINKESRKNILPVESKKQKTGICIQYVHTVQVCFDACLLGKRNLKKGKRKKTKYTVAVVDEMI